LFLLCKCPGDRGAERCL